MTDEPTYERLLKRVILKEAQKSSIDFSEISLMVSPYPHEDYLDTLELEVTTLADPWETRIKLLSPFESERRKARSKTKLALEQLARDYNLPYAAVTALEALIDNAK